MTGSLVVRVVAQRVERPRTVRPLGGTIGFVQADKYLRSAGWAEKAVATPQRHLLGPLGRNAHTAATPLPRRGNRTAQQDTPGLQWPVTAEVPVEYPQVRRCAEASATVPGDVAQPMAVAECTHDLHLDSGVGEQAPTERNDKLSKTLSACMDFPSAYIFS